MMLVLIFTLLLFLITSCYGEEFSSSARNFSIELMYFTHLDHFVMSPFCVWCVMAGAYSGGKGDTNRQISGAFRIPINKSTLFKNYKNLTETVLQSTTSRVDIATTMIIFQDHDTNMLPSFRDTLESRYNAKVRILDFQNTKSKDVANEYIRNIFPTISNVFHGDDFMEVSVIMSNVIHFRGILTTPFNASYTTQEIIYNENKTAVGTVYMMHHTGKIPYSNFESINSYVLELSYGDDGKFCMLLILPYAGIDPIDVYTKLAQVTLKDIFLKLEKDVKELGLQEVDVKIPRFRLRSSLHLHKPLNDMGVYDAFEPELSRFDGITDDNLYISTFEHKSEIVFSEYETVAFATTPGYFDDKRSSHNVKANQPFIFFLMEKPTLTVVFGGIYSRHRNLNQLNSNILFKDD